MKRAIFRQLTIGAFVLATVGPASAQQQRWVTGSEILIGLKGVVVAVENLNPEAERDGLYERALVTAIELRLREAGVRVLTPEEVWRLPDTHPSIAISTFSNEMTVFTYTPRSWR